MATSRTFQTKWWNTDFKNGVVWPLHHEATPTKKTKKQTNKQKQTIPKE